MVNNLYGDYVKGRDLSRFSKEIQRGLRLHRAIDDYMDHHSEVIALQHFLQKELPKISGIALDLFFDHLLAKNWKNYHQHDLSLFLHEFYTAIPPLNEDYSLAFKEMIQQMKKVKWMEHYSSLEGLSKMCHGVASKLSFPNQLSNGVAVFLAHEKEIQTAFEKYMMEAIPYFEALNKASLT